MLNPAPLELRPLGRTGLQVTGLCVGTAPLGDMPDTFDYSVGEEQARATLRAAFAGPITFVDTAASYGDGESERRIGGVLREIGGLPAGFVLASKADRDLKTGDFSGDQMRRSVERSLRLLGLEQLQLLYLHDPEHTTFEKAMEPGGPVEVLQKCKEEGLLAHLGVAGGPPCSTPLLTVSGICAAGMASQPSTPRLMVVAFWLRDQRRILATNTRLRPRRTSKRRNAYRRSASSTTFPWRRRRSNFRCAIDASPRRLSVSRGLSVSSRRSSWRSIPLPRRYGPRSLISRIYRDSSCH